MKPVCLIVMDGWGVNPDKRGNAVLSADTPVLDALARKYPHTTLKCSGLSVGLPEGQMGNSEVGHMTMGAGRVVYQDLTKINRAIEDGSFKANELLKKTITEARDAHSALHVMGLLSDGGVHSHNTHLYAVLEAAKEQGLEDIWIHAFLDGRDTPPRSGLTYVSELNARIREIGAGTVATISGRYYAMDRDTRWERVESAYKAIAEGLGEGEGGLLRAASPEEAVKEAYERGESDEFVKPTVIGAYTGIRDSDSVLFFNFRADRARELTRAFVDEGFSLFDVSKRPTLKSFITMTEYDKELGLPVLFSKEPPVNILAEVLSKAKAAQFRVSETEKYAHVTFFFNGGIETPFALEERELVDSDREVVTYDERPAMRAIEIAEAAATRIKGSEVGFVLLNFANGDMVGHSGVFSAAVEACEAVDHAVGIVVEAALERGFAICITSDHGNAEDMIEAEGAQVITAHSTNPVPFILVDDDYIGKAIREGAGLEAIAPTVLKIMGIDIPREMDGVPLV